MKFYTFHLIVCLNILVDDFSNMAEKGILIIDRVILEELKGGVDLKENLWYIPIINK